MYVFTKHKCQMSKIITIIIIDFHHSTNPTNLVASVDIDGYEEFVL